MATWVLNDILRARIEDMNSRERYVMKKSYSIEVVNSLIHIIVIITDIFLYIIICDPAIIIVHVACVVFVVIVIFRLVFLLFTSC